MRRVVAALAAAVLAATLVACDDGPAEKNNNNKQGVDTGDVSKGGTLTVLSDEHDVDLDPATSQSLPVTALGLVGRRLTNWEVQPGKQPKVVPDLATDTGKPSEGGKVWTFTLKKDLTYADGTKVTAADVKYGLERSFSPSLAGGLGYHKDLLEGAESYKGPYGGKELDSIEVKGERTIVFHLNTAYGDWPWIASTSPFVPVPKAKDTDPLRYGEAPASTGPYRVGRYEAGKQIVLVRNDRWDEKTDEVRTGGPDRVVLTMGQSADVTARRMIADTGDDKDAFGASFVPPEQLTEVRNDTEAEQRLTVSRPGALRYLALNTKRGPMKDVRVRKAMQYAVDKKSFQVAAGGKLGGVAASSLITPGIPGRDPYDLYETGSAGDVTETKELLKDAGKAKGLKLRFLVKNDAYSLHEAQAIQRGLARAGISVKLHPVSAETWTREVTEKDDYDITLATWQPDFPSANGNIEPLFRSSEIGNGGYNLSKYSNPEVDQMIDQATAETDQAKAKKLWAETDRRIMEDAPVVPLIYTRNAFLRGSQVQNFAVAAFPGYPSYTRVSLAE